MSVLDDLARAREAYERREWVSAYRALSDLDDAGLQASDFLALATTAHLLGRHNDCVQALQRAYQAAVAADDATLAFRAADFLTMVLSLHGELAIARGWLARAERLLETSGDEVVERGRLIVAQAYDHITRGEFSEAFALVPQALQYAQRFGDPDLLAMGLHMEGRLTIFSGEVARGLRRLDEALVGVIAGEVSPVWSGVVFCSAIEACQQVQEFGRVGEWTHALTTWCDAQPGLVAFTGQCAVHRGQLMRLHGALREAVEEFERAAQRYIAGNAEGSAGQAHYERGDVLRLLGDYDTAEAAFEAAADLGHPAEPGRTLLWFERGRHEAAASAVRRLLAERPDPVHRSQVLGAAVTVLAATDEVDAAAPLAEELTDLGNAFGCTALRAAGAYATAEVAVARSDSEAALAAARRAVEAWGDMSARHEVARSRVLVGRALRMVGDAESGALELTAARKAFAEAGAEPAEREVAGLLGDAEVPGGLSPREVEVLRLVAIGRSNPAIAAELVLSEKTVARHLSNIFAKLNVSSRTAAAAFAHEHRLI